MEVMRRETEKEVMLHLLLWSSNTVPSGFSSLSANFGIWRLHRFELFLNYVAELLLGNIEELLI